MIKPSSSATAMPIWARRQTRTASPWNEALISGCFISVSAVARTTKSLIEIFGWSSSAFSSSRSSHARSIATSLVT